MLLPRASLEIVTNLIALDAGRAAIGAVAKARWAKFRAGKK